jgi:hypothetical protein
MLGTDTITLFQDPDLIKSGLFEQRLVPDNLDGHKRSFILKVRAFENFAVGTCEVLHAHNAKSEQSPLCVPLMFFGDAEIAVNHFTIRNADQS